MASPETSSNPDSRFGPDAAEVRTFRQSMNRALKPLASLKLTVVLFLLGIFIVLAGTLAQVRADIWEVITEYFRIDFAHLVTSTFPYVSLGELFVWVDANLFFPPSFFMNEPVFPTGLEWMGAFWPSSPPRFQEWVGIWFPKGWVIGIAMMLNLIAAHLVRFRVQATGTRFWMGWSVLGLGSILTVLVILSGSDPDGLQGEPLISYRMVWWLIQTTLFGLCGVSVYAALAADSDHREQRWLFGMLGLVLALGSVFAFTWDPADEAAMRIMYQLVKATFAAVVLLAGCYAVFKKRAGIVLLHAGVLLIMSYDVLVGLRHVESQMQIIEGETVNFSQDIREAEFAVIDRSGADEDLVTVIAAPLLKEGREISDPRLPFEIHIEKYIRNSDLKMLRSFDPEETPPENPATAGVGRQVVPIPLRAGTGTDSDSKVDLPSAYVTLKKDGESLGTYLVSISLSGAQTVQVGEKSYDVALRFKRLYKDYSITLTDVQKNTYMGTDDPRDFSSYIVVNDPSRDLSFEHRVWMNNPMRYAGETFYQSSYVPAGEMGRGSREATVLQVVSNDGWMTPYVGCMIVVVGLMFQFGITLFRFLGRRVHRQIPEPEPIHLIERADHSASGKRAMLLNTAGWVASGVVVLSVVSALAVLGRAPGQKAGEFHVATFGELPMWYRGRIMPIDTFARNSMLQMADRETFVDRNGKRRAAVHWLLDVMADEAKAREHRTIRIEHLGVLEAVGLEPREGFTYSAKELQSRAEQIVEQASKASQIPSAQQSLVHRKIIELANRMRRYVFIEFAFGQSPEIPRPEEAEDDEGSLQRLAGRMDQYLRLLQGLRSGLDQRFRMGPNPLVVPTHLGAERRPPIEAFETEWEPVIIADMFSQFYDEFPAEAPPAITLFSSMIGAYREGDTRAFNQSLAEYRQLLEQHTETDETVLLATTDLEAFYNRFGAFNLASWLYVVAGILAVIGWLGWPQVFQRSAFWLIAAIFVVHTLALIARIYISGRPPVTNLYSSAIFIGWAVVLGGMIIELMSRMGIGNVMAAAAGFLTLRIAHGLAMDGDTFVVLQAVLDTQFWLATHVVCITLGYATTYIAGLLGVLYILLGVFTPGLNVKTAKEITRMTYGAVCFSLLFSFFGTVLGGLWADDSWGRFWGWDPKENGALIIVLWNALILHARWGAMIKDRGLAVLAVLGNITVSWSWFGVNALGEGLHSYGFSDGLVTNLFLLVVSQLLIAGIGCVPKHLWWSAPQPEANLANLPVHDSHRTDSRGV